ncbi:MAG: protease HtpX [Gammaproteobacteria bacterium]|nr:protease HtpX [Gammaproteobacteria bacterium]
MRRILYFVLTNLAIMVVLGIVLRIFGIDGRIVQESGLNLKALFIIAFVFGMGGSFISLLISKWMAKRSTGAHVITQPSNATEVWLINTVRRQAEKAGIGMPEVAIFPSPDPNAFATGANRNNALVAVSTGLLDKMSRDEVEAVLGHEISHVANGDMITLTLIQGVLNTFVIVLARVIGYAVDKFVFRREESGPGMGYFIVSIVAEILLGFLATMIVMWFSRQREFRADAGGANLAGRSKMVNALKRLQAQHSPAQLPEQLAAFGIAGGLGTGLKRLFMSHPPIEERIKALEGFNA